MRRNIYTATLVRVIDGDSLVLDIHLGFDVVLKDQRCRLLGINAPERKKATMAAGDASKNFTSDALRGRALSVQLGPIPKCSFARWLVRLWRDDGHGGLVLFNAEIVQACHAVNIRT